MKKASTFESEIEGAVRDRRAKDAISLIRALVRQDTHNLNLRVRGSEWLRRLGLYREALQILQPELLAHAPKNTRTPAGRALLQLAHIFNELGANEFADHIATGFIGSKPEDFRILGQIYANQFKFQEAEENYRKFLGGQFESSYQGRLARIAYADTCSALGKENVAFDTIEDVLRETKEPLLTGICLQAKGEYLARSGKFKEADVELRSASTYFPQNEGSSDSALLWKWLGFVQAQLGEKQNALENFRRSEAIFLRLRTRPEAFLDVLRLKRLVRLVSDSDWKRALNYTGLSSEFRELLFLADSKIDSSFKLETSYRHILQIDLSRGEYNLKGANRFGITTEMKCIAILRLVENWGISAVRLQSNLWPDEPFSFLQFNKRLEAILHRIRHALKFGIESKDSSLRLLECDQISLILGPTMRPSCLEGKEFISRSQVENAYGVSPSAAKSYLRDWSSRKWIEIEQTRSKVKYKVL